MLPEEFTTKLSESIQRGGDFPVSATIVQDLLYAIENTPEDISTLALILLKDPSLGIRLLHTIRSETPPHSEKPESLHSAIERFGLKQLTEWASSLVAVEGFMATGRPGSIHEKIVTYAMVSSLLVPLLGAETPSEDDGVDETYTLLGWCTSFGILAASINYPHLFTTAMKRMTEKEESLGRAVHTIVGLSPLEVSLAVSSTLDLPSKIATILQQSLTFIPEKPSSVSTHEQTTSGDNRDFQIISSATRMAETILFADRIDLGAILPTVAADLRVNIESVRHALAQLAEAFDVRCSLLGIKASLPEYLVSYSKGRGGGTFVTEQISLAEIHRMKIQEIRESVHRSESSQSVILSAMEFLVWDFGFDRCVFMLIDSQKQIVNWSSYLGHAPLSPIDLAIPLPMISVFENTPSMDPVIRAIQTGQLVEEEVSLLPNGKDATILSVGYKARSVGVLYLDRTAERKSLSKAEYATLTSLSDLLDECIRRSESTAG
jgi:HD-like signal output (HDOD) protein